MLGFNILQSTLPALSALAARGSNKIAATRTRDTTGTGHRLKAFEDLRCQTDRTSCQELILLSSQILMKKMECPRLKPKPPNLILVPALYLLTFCCQASRGLSFVLKKPSTICGTNSSPNSLVPLYKLALVWRLQRLLGNWDNTWSLLKQPCSQRSIWVSSLQPQRSHIRKKWAGHALSAFHAIHTWSRQVSCGRNRRNTLVVECQMIPAFWEACFLRGKLQ